MSIPSSLTPLFSTGAGGAAGYQIERSLRFNSSDSAYLSRTPAVAGNRRTWTWAGWVRRVIIGQAYEYLLDAGVADNFGFTVDAAYVYFGSGALAFKQSSAVFRDPGAWLHYLINFDSTQATAENRCQIWINGVRLTAWSSNPTIPLNFEGQINSTSTHTMCHALGYSFMSAYLADIHFIDGQALTPSSFTEVSATTGQLIPKAYSGGSYGTNGFYLQFADNSSNTATTLGKDTSGNSNNWTPNNLSIDTGGPTSVAAASGALPVFNTTDTYGAVKGSGTRTDTNSASIVLAVPMDGTNNGTTFTDESATIKGSGSAKAITRNGDTKTLTAESKFYGSSGYFDGNGDYLQLANSTDFDFGTGNFTIEAWVYTTATSGQLLLGYDPINEFNFDTNALYFGRSGTFSSTLGATVSTNTWQHIALVRSGSTITGYVNGIAGSTPYNISTNTVAFTTGTGTLIGRNHISAGTAKFFSGYIQDFRIYKGAAKYTSNFNPPSSTANATIGAGNDSLVDTPTSYGTDTGVGGEVRGNYATLNPLIATSATLSNGNLDFTATATYQSAYGTIGMRSGKWYFEATVGTFGSDALIGVGSAPFSTATYVGASATSWGYAGAFGSKWNNGSSSGYGASFGSGDVISVAFDADTGKLWFAKNGTWQASGDPATGANPAFTLTTGIDYLFGVAAGNSGTWSCNFGQRAFAYTAPSGFKALCDTNLGAPVVAKPNTVMDVKLYTGNGSTQAISGLGFSPDLVWIKARSAATAHLLFDQIRGATYYLSSNATDAESNSPSTTLTAFTSDGFTLGSNSSANGSSVTLAAWAWDAGTTTASNPDGSITSQVRANVSAGFSVVTYTGTGANATVGHGLGVAPQLLIVKRRSSAGTTANWAVWHGNLTAGYNMWLNGTDNAQAYSPSRFTSTLPTSTVFSLGGGDETNYNTGTYVAYCFAPVVGYSSFGRYTGNGSADGPFVYTGFRPRWVMIKRSDSTSNWFLVDTARDTSNVSGFPLFPNSPASEVDNRSYTPLDILSNGFKLRTSTLTGGTNINISSATYIFASFAENPFQYARAR